MGDLGHVTILEIHRAVVSSHLLDSRAALLTGINPAFTGGIAQARSPVDQLFHDLDALNAAGTLMDGSSPLKIWLTNAVARVGPKKEAAIFQAALRLCGGATEGHAVKTNETLSHLTNSFTTTYRKRMAAVFNQWDRASAVIVQSSEAQLRNINFDEMYHPLGVAGDDAAVSGVTRDEAGLLALLERQRGLVVRGACGSGKTTWTRWQFRQLLATERAFPVMIALPDLALRWQKAEEQGNERSIDAYIDSWCKDYGVEGWKAQSRSLLENDSGPVPIVFLDGWDEIGHIGNELYPKLLGLMNEFTRVRVVITSRHYGDALPGKRDEFAELHVLSLSKGDVAAFAERFLAKWYVDDRPGAAASLRRFLAFLDQSPEAVELARVPLLLTLMLQIHESGHLPQERHLLYGACVDTLLNRRPDRKVAEGAVWHDEQTYPIAHEKRKRIVAEFAANLQHESKDGTGRAIAVRSMTEMEALLPSNWPETVPAGSDRVAARHGFLNWLTTSAALMAETPRGVGFVHVGFQEYLTAWHLDTTVDGDVDRAEAFAVRAAETRWWDTLLLWAGMLYSKNDQRVQPILERLTRQSERSASKLLAGTMLAQGMGNNIVFQQWLLLLENLVTNSLSQEIRACASAWEGSFHASRRAAMLTQISLLCSKGGFFKRIHLEKFAAICALLTQVPLPAGGTMEREVSQVLRFGQFDTSRSVAAARLLCQLDPDFTGLYRVPDVAWLSLLWPSQRSKVSYLLQLSVAFGATESDVKRQASKLLRKSKSASDLVDSELERSMRASALLGWNKSGAPEEGANETAGLIANPILNVMRTLAYYIHRESGDPKPPTLANRWQSAKIFSGNLRSIIQRARKDDSEGTRSARTLTYGKSAAEEVLAHAMNLDPDTTWLLKFAFAVAASHFETNGAWDLLPAEPPQGHWSFLVPAYRIHLGSKSERVYASFQEALDAYGNSSDPLWPALARHLVHRSTEEDRNLLVDLAAHPDKRNSTIGMALKYIARGDVSLNDGGDVTLDDLSKELGLEPLPYLEEAPLPREITSDDIKKAELNIRANEFGKRIGSWRWSKR